MKKFIPLALGLAICCAVPTFATSAEPDLKSYSDEDLQKLYTDVKTELTSRNLTTGDSIGSGVYIIGTDIKVGRYKFTSDNDGSCVLYASKDDYDSRDKQSTSYVNQGESTDLNLTDGMVIELYSSGTLETSNPSWAAD